MEGGGDSLDPVVKAISTIAPQHPLLAFILYISWKLILDQTTSGIVTKLDEKLARVSFNIKEQEEKRIRDRIAHGFLRQAQRVTGHLADSESDFENYEQIVTEFQDHGDQIEDELRDFLLPSEEEHDAEEFLSELTDILGVDTPVDALDTYLDMRDLVADRVLFEEFCEVADLTEDTQTELQETRQKITNEIDEFRAEINQSESRILSLQEGFQWLTGVEFRDKKGSLSTWKGGYGFNLEDIYADLDYNRALIDTKNDGSVVLLGDPGYSKTTIFLQEIVNRYKMGDNVLYNDLGKIENPKQVVEAAKKPHLLGSDSELLIAVDDVHRADRIPALALPQLFKQETSTEQFQRISFLFTARPRPYGETEHLPTSIDKNTMIAIKKSREILDGEIRISEFQEPEAREFFDYYYPQVNNKEIPQEEADEKFSEFYDRTRGHPLLMTYSLVGKGLDTNVTSVYNEYILGGSEMIVQPTILRNAVAVCLLGWAEIPLTSEFITAMDLTDSDLERLRGIFIRQVEEDYWEPHHPNWNREFLIHALRAQEEHPAAQSLPPLRTIIKEKIDSVEDVTIRGQLIKSLCSAFVNDPEVHHDSILLEAIAPSLTPPSFFSKVERARAYYSEISWMYDRIGAIDDAIDAASKAIDLLKEAHDDGNDVEFELCGAYNNRALHYEGKNDHTSAQKDYDRAIEYCPEDIDVRTNKAILCAYCGQFETAINEFDAILDKNPPNEEFTRVKKAKTLLQCEKDGAIDQARKELEAACELNPEYAEPYFLYGYIAFQEENYELADARYTEALNRDSNHSQAYYFRGLVRVRDDSLGDPVSDFTKAGYISFLQNLLVDAVECFKRARFYSSHGTETWCNVTIAIAALLRLQVIAIHDLSSEEREKAWREVEQEFSNDYETYEKPSWIETGSADDISQDVEYYLQDFNDAKCISSHANNVLMALKNRFPSPVKIKSKKDEFFASLITNLQYLE